MNLYFSRSRHHGFPLSLVAVSISSAFILHSATLYAGGCAPSGPAGTYVCSNPTNISDTHQTLSGAPLVVSTEAGFGISTSSGYALTLRGVDGLTFTDLHQSTISGINTQNTGSGDTHIITTGTVSGDGINALNAGTNLTIEAADVSGEHVGIYAENHGSGALNITSTGAVAATYEYGQGVSAYNLGVGVGTDLTITVADVSGGTFGIDAYTEGSGAITITATGAVVATYDYLGYGILAYNTNLGTDLTINAADVSGGIVGIFAYNYGRGDLNIIATGTVAATNERGQGIYVMNAGTDLSINAVDVLGGTIGIFADNLGSGDLNINTTGAVLATYDVGQGIYASNVGTDLSITAVDVSGGTVGIFADNSGSGDLNITTTGAVAATHEDGQGIYALNAGTDLTITAADVSGGSYGIYADNRGSGDLSITTSGVVVATYDEGWAGISATNAAGDVIIKAADVSGGSYGIEAYSDAGSLNITTTGAVAATLESGAGINAWTQGTDLTIKAVDVSGGAYGINAGNNGRGEVNIIATGAVAATQEMGLGIFANSYGTDLSINAVDVSGGIVGIAASNSGSGDLNITTTGVVMATHEDGYGISADNLGTDLSINATDVSGGIAAIVAENSGSGSLNITTTGSVAATHAGGAGITASNSGTDLTISAADVSGGSYGIYAGNRGRGEVNIIATGAVAATYASGYGIDANNFGTDLTITAADVSGGAAGIGASNFGSGTLNITTTGVVVGTTSNGIDAFSGSSSITVNNTGMITGGDKGIILSGGNSTVINTGTITGQSGTAIEFDQDQSLNNRLTLGTGSVLNGNVLGGSGSDALILTGINTEDASKFINMDSLIMQEGDWTLAGTGEFASNVNVVSGVLRVNGLLDSPLIAVQSSGTFLAGGVNVLSAGSAVDIQSGGMFDLSGYRQTVASLNNAGTVNVAGEDGPGATLTVTGDYLSNGGHLQLSSILKDDTSLTDRLVVGSATLGLGGATGISIVNKGGLGALTTGDGIEVVHVMDSAASAAGAFTLASRVTAGAYDYTLHNRAGGNWYLTSAYVEPEKPIEPGPVDPESPVLPPETPVAPGPVDPESPGRPPETPIVPGPVNPELPNYRPEVPLYMAAPALASHVGLTSMGTYHERRGDDLGRDSSDSASWGRVLGRSGSVHYQSGSAAARASSFASDGPSYDYTITGIQVGTDVLDKQNDDGMRDVAGLYVSAIEASANVDALYVGNAGSMDMSGYSLGGYWTHKSESGAYVEGVVQGTRYDDANARSSLGQRAETAGWGVTTSIEGGKAFDLGNRWTIEPQAQLIYQHITLDDMTDDYGHVDFGSADSTTGRVGARLSKALTTNKGLPFVVSARTNLWRGFGSDAKTTFRDLSGNNATTLTSNLSGSWGQVGVGISGNISQDITLYVDADYSQSLESRKANSVGGKLGISIAW